MGSKHDYRIRQTSTRHALMFDVQSIRKDFPIFSQNENPFIFLDSASTTQKPQSVIDAVSSYYDSYAAKIVVAKEIGIEGMIDGFMQAAGWGTPDRILREFEKRREIIGDFELATSFRFGGTPYEVAEQSIKLFAKEVLPVLKSWKKSTAKQAAE